MTKSIYMLLLVCVCLLLAGCPVLIPVPGEGSEGEGEPPLEGEAQAEGESGAEIEGETEGEPEGIDPYLLALEQEVFLQINERRAAEGAPELFMDSRVRLVSRAHSEDMASRDYFAHNNLSGKSPGERLDAAAIPWVRYGENLAYNYAYSDPATIAVEGWMDSDGHRENLLDPKYTHTGIGIAVDSKGAYYITQDFVTY